MPLFGTVTTPADRARALASIRAAGDLGRELADLAVLVFGAAALLPNDSHPQTHMRQGFAALHRANDSLPSRPCLRGLFDEHLTLFLPDLFSDWHGMLAEDRDYLQRVAAMVFDRRLALHAAAPARFGGAA